MGSRRIILSFLKWLAAFFLAGLVLVVVRHWAVESYCISTNAMQGSLHPGDYILVNKWKNADNPGRNRVVLFHSPMQSDSLANPLFVSRCIGMPGDTILVNDEGYTINGKLLPFPPNALQTYLVPDNIREICLRSIRILHIPLREWTKAQDGYILRLTSFEAYQVCEEMGVGADSLRKYDTGQQYKLIVPGRGEAYRVDEFSLPLCKEAIYRETKGKARFEDDKLFLNEQETSHFSFSQDYYWVLSDNVKEGIDSRHLGFIPHDHIIGNAWFCWYSKDRGHFLKYIQ